jgi:hypothetical protein
MTNERARENSTTSDRPAESSSPATHDPSSDPVADAAMRELIAAVSPPLAEAASVETNSTNTAGEPGTGSESVEVVEEDDAGEAEETVTRPGKLIRIATMVRSMLDEVRRAPLDDAGRRALSTIHARSLAELSEVLSDDLRQELAEMALPLSDETVPTESEIRIAQAQLVGWLEGLFHGIQATMATQQAMAQAQLAQMRNRALQPGVPDPTAGSPSVGQYL